MPRKTRGILFIIKLIEAELSLSVLEHELRIEELTALGGKSAHLGGRACIEQTSDLCFGNIPAADGDAHSELASVGKAHTAVVVLAAHHVLTTKGTLADDLAEFTRINGGNGSAASRIIEY